MKQFILTKQEQDARHDSLSVSTLQAREDCQVLSLDGMARYLVDAGDGNNALKRLAKAIVADAALDGKRWATWLVATVNVDIDARGNVKQKNKKDAPALLVQEKEIELWWKHTVNKTAPAKRLTWEQLRAELVKWSTDNKGDTANVTSLAQFAAGKALEAIDHMDPEERFNVIDVEVTPPVEPEVDDVDADAPTLDADAPADEEVAEEIADEEIDDLLDTGEFGLSSTG
jgi:hypothetical protein